MQTVERWDRFELILDGPSEGNPFVDVQLGATFTYMNRAVPAEGFYDGDGGYCVRFMPDEVGTWRYVTQSNVPALDGVAGEFLCEPAGPDNHGPVQVRHTYHLAYADGTTYLPIGTTCYVWNHQGDELEEQTLRTLAEAPFNKMRMCVFPKSYRFNQNEPEYYPFEGGVGNWDFTRLNPAFFQHLEQRIEDLLELGIEADLILFHPYDRWGFAQMDPASDDRYLRYVVARLAAYRNIWWSFANEYDLMESKEMGDWDRFFQLVQTYDPAQHLRSIHNCRGFYDHSKRWVTHCSVQHSELDKVPQWREAYGKPVVVDECRYEGNIELGWGNISAQELVHRFWLGTAGGGYMGHGETYLHPEDILWWSKGGVLRGQSPARIAFLRDILEEAVAEGIEGLEPLNRLAVGVAGQYYLYYYGLQQPAIGHYALPGDGDFRIELIDPWAMTIEPFDGVYRGNVQVDLPGRPYLAVRIRRL